MLCSVLMNGFTDALKELEWTPGGNFDIVTISIAPVNHMSWPVRKKSNT